MIEKSIFKDGANKKLTHPSRERGITLIALVVTIVVLLILAGVSLAMLTGENGIITQATELKFENQKAEAKEKIELALQEYNVEKQYAIANSKEYKTLQECLVNAGATEVISSGKKGIIEVGNSGQKYKFEIKEEKVIISDIATDELTLAQVWNENMIGKTINYKTNNTLPSGIEWIIIGKDANGNILATTSRPLGTSDAEESYKFQIQGTVENWLTYEDDLDQKCANLFSGKVQGEDIVVRSITMKDINTVMGFTEPTLNEYTFEALDTNDYANKNVYYYHPDANTENKWSRNYQKYYCDSYEYKQMEDENGKYIGIRCEANGWSYAKYVDGELKNADLILGPSDNRFEYATATKGLKIFSTYVIYSVGNVLGGVVDSGDNHYCMAEQSRMGYNYNTSKKIAIRPVIELPEYTVVTEGENGEYSLSE